MNCPHCKDVTLTKTERQGVEIDYCPKCRGVWPLMVLLLWWNTRQRAIELPPPSSIDLAFLLLPTLYAFLLLLKNRIDLMDAAVLVALFGLYLWRVGRLPREEDEEDEDPGPAAALAVLPRKAQWSAIAALCLVAAARSP